MAYSTLQKLLRHQTQTSKIITNFCRPFPSLQPHSPIQFPQISSSFDPISKQEADCLKQNHSSYAHIYPSFSFGFFLNSISPSTIIRFKPDVGEVTQDDSNVIRADSTKKKRKRKMNKHKLKKLRKRLRRKT